MKRQVKQPKLIKYTGIDERFWDICDIYSQVTNKPVNITDAPVLNIRLQYAVVAFTQKKIDLEKHFNEYYEYLKSKYLNGDSQKRKEGGNLRFLSFVLMKKHIDEYLGGIALLSTVKELRKIFNVYSKVKTEHQGFCSEECSFGNNKEIQEKRLKIFSRFNEWLNSDEKNSIQDYFEWFFTIFMPHMTKADPTTSAGFWFSIAVLDSYINYRCNNKRSNRKLDNVEEDY